MPSTKNQQSGLGVDWSFFRVQTNTGGIYTVGIYGNEFAVLRGFSVDLGKAVESVDTEPTLGHGAKIAETPPSGWIGCRLHFGSVQTSIVSSVQPEQEDRLIQRIVERYGAPTTSNECAPASDGPGHEPDAERSAGEQNSALTWLDKLPSGGVREVFAHIAQHGAITETEMAEILGGPRAVRKFSRGFEGYSAHAPFAIEIQQISGLKRYTRDQRGGRGR